MGEVYLGDDVQLGRQVAIKLVNEVSAARISSAFPAGRTNPRGLNHPYIARLYAALQIFESLHAADPTNAKVRRFIGVMHERMGAMLALRNDAAGAIAEYQRSAAIRVPMAAESPNDTNLARDAAIAYEKLGSAMVASGDVTAALVNRQKSLELFRSLLDADPKNVLAQHSLAVSHIHFADWLGGPDSPNLGRSAEAMENYRLAIGLLEASKRADAANAARQRDLAEAQAKLAKLTGTTR